MEVEIPLTLYRQKTTDRVEYYLREAKVLRRIAAALSLHQARAVVIQSAIECDQMAASLEKSEQLRLQQKSTNGDEYKEHRNFEPQSSALTPVESEQKAVAAQKR